MPAPATLVIGNGKGRALAGVISYVSREVAAATAADPAATRTAIVIVGEAYEWKTLPTRNEDGTATIAPIERMVKKVRTIAPGRSFVLSAGEVRDTLAAAGAATVADWLAKDGAASAKAAAAAKAAGQSYWLALPLPDDASAGAAILATAWAAAPKA